MIQSSTYTQGAFVLFLSAFLIAIGGLNMPITWYIHRNGFHEADVFFNFYTQTAEWLLIVIAAILSFYTNRIVGIVFLATASIQGLIVLAIKQWVNAPRPATVAIEQIRSIPGVPLQYWNSFPSGHTAIAVLCYGFIALSINTLLRKNNKIVQLCLLYLAAAMAYSRIYLGQHSLLDVSIGGILALIFLQTSQWIIRNWLTKVV